MKIVLSGVETNNKGAELMLYAILQEIERKYPEAIVYVAPDSIYQGLGYIKTSLNLKNKPIAYLMRICRLLHLYGIVRRLHITPLWFYDIYAVKGTDYFIDDGGFHFSDKWDLSEEFIQQRRMLWESHKKEGTKIIFLPQAFGPFEKNKSRQYLSYMAKCADLIMPREMKSYDYLEKSGMVNMQKVKKYSDFTVLVDGVFPQKYENLKGGVCIIPNIRMTDKGGLSVVRYVNLLTNIINHIHNQGYMVYILNHEGKDDENLAYLCQQKSDSKIEVVTGLNALEVKGLISTAYMVVTSRFHGLVSSLNSCVPCLSTGWSHKYAELYKDYELEGCILPLDNDDSCYDMIDRLLISQQNAFVRSHLQKIKPRLQQEARRMWEQVWNI